MTPDEVIIGETGAFGDVIVCQAGLVDEDSTGIVGLFHENPDDFDLDRTVLFSRTLKIDLGATSNGHSFLLSRKLLVEPFWAFSPPRLGTQQD